MKRYLSNTLMIVAMLIASMLGHAIAQTTFLKIDPFFWGSTCSNSTTASFTAAGCYMMETTGSSSFTVTLPTLASVPIGKMYNLKHLGTGTITFSGNGAETIDGAVTFSVVTQYQSVTVYKNVAGTAWSIQ